MPENDIATNAFSNIVSGIVSGIIANIFTAALFFLLIYSVYLYLLVKERKKLLRFLGVNRKFSKVKILLSRIEVKPGGSEPVEGEKIRNGYVGAAISKPEYDAALIICEKINPKWLATIPNTLRDYLSRKYISFTRLETTIDVSPKNMDELPETNLILIGANVYNSATKFYLNHSKDRASFEFALKDSSAEGGVYERIIKLRKYGMEEVEIPGRSKNRELGIIQKMKNKDIGNTVFICAGLGDQATFGCAKYLAENMVDLETKYKQQEFGICLAFEKSGNDIINSSPPKVIEEILFDS